MRGEPDVARQLFSYADIEDRIAADIACVAIWASVPDEADRRIGDGAGDRQFPPSGEGRQPHVFILSVNGIEIVVIPMAEPLPRDGYDAAADRSILWQDAKSMLAGNKAHVVVAALRETSGHAEALAAAFAVTVVSAAIMRITRAIGAVFNPALTAFPADEFTTLAAGLAQQRQIPEMLWVSIGFVRGPELPGGQPSVGVSTLGLSAFVGREIEFMPVAWQPGQVARRVLGLAQYLILNGPVIRDGDTVGDTPSERIAVELRDRGQWQAAPVMRLSAEGTRP